MGGAIVHNVQDFNMETPDGLNQSDMFVLYRSDREEQVYNYGANDCSAAEQSSEIRSFVCSCYCRSNIAQICLWPGQRST